ncbi:hypothetical protein OKW36_001447 [Paraburkholderia sp. MM5482-R1]
MGEEHAARNHVARIRMHLHHADRRARERRMTQADFVDELHDARGAQQRVAAARHGRRPRVRLLAREHDFVPALTLRVGDHADRPVFGLEYRPLFDVQFERRVNLAAAARQRARVADALQFLADGLAVDVLARQSVLERKHTRKYARGHHRRREARAFFVGPDHRFNRALGFDAVIVERANHFEAAEHPIDTVEAPTGWLRVRVRAGHHGRQVVVAPRAAHKHVAHLIDTDRAARLFRPLHDEIAALLVEVGQRQTAHAAFGRGANPGHLHQAVPQSLTVHVDRGRQRGFAYCVHACSPVRARQTCMHATVLGAKDHDGARLDGTARPLKPSPSNPVRLDRF